MCSVANRDYVMKLGAFLSDGICARVTQSDSSTAWTRAVHETLREFANRQTPPYSMNPSERCYKGEYLCDFTLHEKGYGCRIACESQWCNWRKEQQGELDWAFDKLRGVKADVKVFVFEGEIHEWKKTIAAYLDDYSQLSRDEAFLALRWEKPRFVTSWWQPKHDGRQAAPVEFEVFSYGEPNNILDKRGNNYAIKCPACTGTFIFSGFLDGAAGRSCPHCSGSLAKLNGEDVTIGLVQK